jgi:putative ABC transport system permease protein
MRVDIDLTGSGIIQTMYNIYLKIGIRNFFKRGGYSFINIAGLATGMAVTLIITLWVWDEMSYNKYADNYPSVARVLRKGKAYNSYVCPTGLGTLIKSDYGNHFKNVVLVRARLEERAIVAEDKKFLQNGYFMQEDGPELFRLKMRYGNRKGLNDINSILLSASLSEKLFGKVDPVNKIIKMDASWDLRVTGVYEDLPGNSDFSDASYFAPLDLYLKGWSSLNIWNNYNMYIYVEINQGEDFNTVSNLIKDIAKVHEDDASNDILLHPWSDWKHEYVKGTSVISARYVRIYLIGSIAVFILLLACINFINLSTARYDRRSKEVGIKKAIGSSRGQIIFQFLSESAIFVVISWGLAVFVADMILPFFNEIADKKLTILWNNPFLWIISFSIVMLTIFLAGSYPALYLSSFNPVKALKGAVIPGGRATILRKALVVFQFTVTVILITGSIIVYKQVQMARNRPVGYNPEGLLTLPIRSQDYNTKFEVLRNELKKSGYITEMARANYPITSDKGWNTDFNWEGKDPGNNVSLNWMLITPEYCNTVGLKIVEGRDFSREISTDQSGILINRSAVKAMGLKNPVGQVINCPPIKINEKKDYIILGVTDDIIKGSPYEASFPSVMFCEQDNLSQSFIRINPETNLREAITSIEKVFNVLVPSVPFDYKFVNEEYKKKFSSEERIGKLAGIFGCIAIIISCMGLFGLASYLTEQRSKELGIRKVNGATVYDLWMLLSADFIKLVIISNIIAAPLSLYLLSKWIRNYPYHIQISWWMIGTATLITILVALITISYHTLKAAYINPVKYLRSE